MKAEMLLDPLGEIDDKFLEDDGVKAPVTRYGWLKWAAVAACLVVVAAIAIPALSKINNQLPAEEQRGASLIGLYGDGEDGLGETAHHFNTYESFATMAEDPIFEAFAASDEAQDYDFAFTVTDFERPDGEPFQNGMPYKLSSISIDFNPQYMEDVPTLNVSDPMVTRYYDNLRIQGNFPAFRDEGALDEYEVDGFAVQKYGSYERIHIGEVWYHVQGSDEAEVDALVELLARLATQLDKLPTNPDGYDLKDYAPDDENDVLAGIADALDAARQDHLEENTGIVEEDPVLEALVGSDEFGDFTLLDVRKFEETRYLTVRRTGGSTAPNNNPITVEGGYLHEEERGSFASAESHGVRSDYQVDGIAVQKFYQKDLSRETGFIYDENGDWYEYYEQVCIDGKWYVVYGLPEADVDIIATALAHIAAQQ